jgi:hypothetical protein
MYCPVIMNTFHKNSTKYVALLVFVLMAVIAAGSLLAGQPQTPAGGGNGPVVYGDTVLFLAPGVPNSCTHRSRFKHGENIGFRMTAINPETGKRDRTSQLVVHLTFDGKTLDLPMRDRQNDRSPEREFWIAKWTVPADVPIGIVHYSVTAKDAQGRTGEYKPFRVDESELAIVE